MKINLGFKLVYWNLKSVNWWLSYSSFADSGADDCCLSLNGQFVLFTSPHPKLTWQLENVAKRTFGYFLLAGAIESFLGPKPSFRALSDLIE